MESQCLLFKTCDAPSMPINYACQYVPPRSTSKSLTKKKQTEQQEKIDCKSVNWLHKDLALSY